LNKEKPQMTKLTLLCWQEIPSLVEAKDSSGSHKIELSLKFQELIDLIAMKRGLDGSDDYLMQWGKEKQPDTDTPAPAAAEALAREIEARYEQIKSDAIANC
jgi:hypothetical protein